MHSTPAHFTPACGNYGYCQACQEPVKQSPDGRWYITMGHAGFNSRANNRTGYANRQDAVAAHRKYASK